uniref:DUF2231 domain-containing protein n=1 Tax=Roseihalotalea indica TaxID=2867963 RepID=A0AA49GPF7_9BACT|nr:hypothetical protein K4G66_07780 [Tunicatimonas sp. TK19036]
MIHNLQITQVKVLWLVLFLALAQTVSFAHEGEQTEKSDSASHQASAYQSSGDVQAEFSDFPNLHPLVVHIPIVMLPLAVVLQLIGFFVFSRPISWIVLGILVLGFLGAYAANNWTHPHVTELPDRVQEVYNRHDTYAAWTLWLSGIAAVLKIASHFLLKSVRWAEGVIAIVLLACTYTVSVAGHYGSQLVHVEGVGPQGNYLETEAHSH